MVIQVAAPGVIFDLLKNSFIEFIIRKLFFCKRSDVFFGAIGCNGVGLVGSVRRGRIRWRGRSGQG